MPSARLLASAACAASMGWTAIAGAQTNSDIGLEDIVVTAQKRSERLQDVPISVSAITANAALQRGIATTEDLSAAVPSLNFVRSGQYANPYIRGVGTTVVGQGDESSVAVYVDGVLQVAPSGAIFSLNNIERVEVLKGPQGTLFGRNATGGVINIITRKPGDRPMMDASIGYANFETVEAKLYASTPLVDGVAMDVAMFIRNQGDGWGRDLNSGRKAYADRELNLRSKLLLTPSDRTEITLTGSLGTGRDGAGAFRYVPGETGLFGNPSPGFYNTVNGLYSQIKSKRYDASLRWEQDLDFAQLVSISGYSRMRIDWPYDADSSPTVFVDALVHTFDRSFTQEVQLLSPRNGRFQWIVGGYYLDALSSFDPLIIYGSSLPIDYVSISAGQKARSLSGFAQASYNLTPSTRLTLGGRYTSDKRHAEGRTDTPFGPGAIIEGRKTFNKLTYRIALDQKIGDDLMVYGSWTTGFKAGLFNTVDPSQAPVNPENIRSIEGGFKSEFFDRRLQVNLSAFHYKYKDLQVGKVVAASIVTQNAGAARVKGIDLDISAAPIANLSVQASLSYLDARFTDFKDAPLYLPLPGGGREVGVIPQAGGNRMTRAPKWAANIGGQYRIETESGDLTLAANYSYKSRYFWDVQNSFRESPQHVVNASLTWALPDDHVEFSIWGKNLADEKINNYVAPQLYGYAGTPQAPRTYGGTIRFKFD